ncbi:hypothetical protein V8F20_004432 [Naviculisporaceae sp. PSN 640]
MGSLKRKERPSAAQASKSPKPTSDSRPSKRTKSSESGKDEGKKKKDDSKSVTAPVVSRLKEEEPLFPRGGGSILSPLEHKQIQIQAKNDVLFEQESGKGKKKDKGAKASKKDKRKSKGDESSTKAARDEDAVKIESLNFKRLVKGSLVLGQISSISSLGVSVALPNNLTGHVPITAISDILTQRLQANLDEDGDDDMDDENEDDVDLESIFEIGQYVRAYVMSTLEESSEKQGKAKKHIELSLQPQLANSEMSEQDVVTNCTLMASVVSVEDHGFVMDIGIPGLKAFLPKKQVEKDTPEERFHPGSVLLCLATGKRANVVQLSALRETIGNTSHHPAEATTIGTFLPGTAADILVSEVSEHGIVGKVMGHLDVTADLVHSGAGPEGIELEEKYKVGSRLKARIICNFPNAKAPKLGISILSHVLSLSSKMANPESQPVLPQNVLAHSAMVECKVRTVEPDIGLYVDVGVDGVPGFVHISRVKDGKIDTLFKNSGPYQPGSVHPGRVVGYNAFDGMFLISLEKSVLEQPFLRIEDIPVGAVVPGTVEKLVVNAGGLGGVIVKISEGISGLVPEMHLADVHLQHPEKKYREGMKVKARVLSTNPAMHQVRLTLKKTLVNSDQPTLKSYDELAVGLQAPGTIINILQHGAIVQFYGPLRGFLPVSEMSEAYIQDPKEHFRIGQVVTIYVISFDPEAHKLIVSCKDPSAFGLEKQVALQKLKIGDVVSAKVTQKTEDDIFVELTEGSLKAILPVAHLTDKSASKTQSALKKIHVGQLLSDLVVLEKNEGRRSITVSHKPSLVKAAQEQRLLTKLEDAMVGDLRHGFVRNITPTAVFVEFAARVTALLPKPLLPAENQILPDFGLHKFQPLAVKVHSVIPDQRRLIVGIPSENGEIKMLAKKAEEAVNSLDPTIRSMDDISVGRITKAKIMAVKDNQLNVKLADNVQGRVDVSNMFDSWDEIEDPKHPLKKFSPKQIVDVRVLGIHDARNHRFLPITHRSSHSVLELSMKRSDLEAAELPKPLSFDKIKTGANYIGFVNNIARANLCVSLSTNVRGRLGIMEASDDLTQLNDISESFPIGCALKVRVTAVDSEKEHLDLSARSSGSKKDLTWENIQQNMVIAGKITKVTDRQIVVKLSETLAGPVHLADLADDYDEANPLKYNTGDFVRVAVVGLDRPNKKIRLSTRPSRVLNSSLPVKDREISKTSKIEVGDIIRGHVKNVSDKGLFIALGGDVTAMSKVKNLSDSFLKDWKEHFQVDQLVTGRVISVADGRIEMSLKPSVIDKNYVPLLTIEDLKEGQIVTGKVRKVEDFGAFIDIDRTDNVSGLCHRSEMADKPVKDAKTLYNAGDAVKAIVLKVDRNAKKINLGLKPSYFDDEGEMDVDDEDAGAALGSDGDEESGDEEMSDDGGAVAITGTDNVDSDSDSEDEDGDISMAEPEVKGLDVGGFDWSAGSLDVKKTAVSDLKAIEKEDKKKSRREPNITVDKTAELDVNGPQTSSDYERLLLGQPDSSQLWIAYMAFQMQVSELASARKVAERAIKTINIREQAEKLNVWIAYLNLEVAYGTDESVEDVFKRACTYNDEEEVHKALASIYIQSSKRKDAKELFEKMIKKFGSKSVDVWANYAQFLHTTAQDPDGARALLKRATQTLGAEKHLYLTLVPKFAALEFRSPNGDRDQGRTLFESLLATYPKRFDLWNQLMDLETSVGKADPVVVRDLFERGSKVKGLKPKQAQTWFRRWAQWEEKNGDGKSRAKVSAKAQEWARAVAEKKNGGKGKEDEDDE